MEFIKVKNGYLIKNSNGRIVSEKEKLELENKELILKDIKSNECQGKTTQKLTKNKKKIKEIEEKYVIEDSKIKNDEANEPLTAKVQLNSRYDTNYKTALKKGESADDIIKETDNTI